MDGWDSHYNNKALSYPTQEKLVTLVSMFSCESAVHDLSTASAWETAPPIGKSDHNWKPIYWARLWTYKKCHGSSTREEQHSPSSHPRVPLVSTHSNPECVGGGVSAREDGPTVLEMRVFNFDRCPISTNNQNLAVLVPCANQEKGGKPTCVAYRSFSSITFTMLASLAWRKSYWNQKKCWLIRWPALAVVVGVGRG